MRIKILHPYKILGDWNHRLKRQFELIGKEAEIVDDKPDLIYAVGYEMGAVAMASGIPYVYDMGSFICRTIFFENYGLNFKRLKFKKRWELWGLLNRRHRTIAETEKNVLLNAKAVISWDSEQIELIWKLFGKDVKIHRIDMLFSKLPRRIKFENKEKRVISIAAKWTSEEKGRGILAVINKKIPIYIVGKYFGSGSQSFLPHNTLMDILNKSRVLFCPYWHGGNGVIMEGLRLGCNVVIGDYHPFKKYVNPELIYRSGQGAVEDAIEKINMALNRYSPPACEIPTEKEQLKKIMEICQEIEV